MHNQSESPDSNIKVCYDCVLHCCNPTVITEPRLNLLDSYNLSRKKKILYLDIAKSYVAKCKKNLIIEFRCIRIINKVKDKKVYSLT